MKKILKKLSLNKQTMALLDEKEMMNVKGGDDTAKIAGTTLCTPLTLSRFYNCGVPSIYCSIIA